jgi:diguanylate cyclase (GGDEF)-like protein/PAS domain S-box-containing protein
VSIPAVRAQRAAPRIAGRRRLSVPGPESGAQRPDQLSALAMQCAPDAIYVLGPDRRIMAWNQQAQALTGYAPEHVVGQVCSARLLNHVDEAGLSLCGPLCPLRLTMSDGIPRQATVFVHHLDGHLVPVEVRSAVMRTAAGLVVGAVETFRDATATVERDRRILELEDLAYRDPLTGVGNRRAMDRLLTAYRDEQRAAGPPFAAMLFDLDRFKLVNDGHGHTVGDRVLKAVAATLQAGTRGHVVRYGGEEFLVLAPAQDESEALAAADTLRRLVGAVHVPARGGHVTVSVSVGVALAAGHDTAARLLARADRALFAAKATGRDRAVLA